MSLKEKIKDKAKKGAVAAGIALSSMAPVSAGANTPQPDHTPEKYKKNITVRNDSVQMVGNNAAYYSHNDRQIYIKKGDISFKDFGNLNTPPEVDPVLSAIHERQHLINQDKCSAILSLNEDYQRNVHDEITALIAEKLEIRRQYREAKTPQAKSAVLDKYATAPEHKDFINAIKSGQIKPDSSKSADFDAEMTFIKNDATSYRADPNDDAYRKGWSKLSLAYLNTVGENAKSDPDALHREVHAMYQIGGIDFTRYGEHKDFVLENQSITTADKLLQQGGDPQKIAAFLNEGEGPFRLAETLDVSGLSREQAEKVLQTAIVAQELSDNISGDMCLNTEPSYDFYFVSRNLRKKTALYLDMKSDIWEKNGTLSAQGDPEKFAALMQQAQTIKLDPEAWYKSMGRLIRRGKFDMDEVEKRITEFQGKTVNIGTTITNMDEFTLPLDGTSKEEVLQKMAREAKEDADFLEEYYRNNPPEKPRLSDPYEISIMDLQSSILSDELASRKEAENRPLTIEPLYPSQPNGNKVSSLKDVGRNQQSFTGETYKNAELRETLTATGETVRMTLLDGKIHGAVLTQDKNGNITNCELYDHGKKIDASRHKMEIFSDVRNGATISYVTLDGKKFGTELVTSPDGRAKAAFYDIVGLPVNGADGAGIKHSKIQETVSSELTNNAAAKEQLKKDLKEQTGELYDSPLSRSQNIRITKHMEERAEQSISSRKSASSNADVNSSTSARFLSQNQQSR